MTLLVNGERNVQFNWAGRRSVLWQLFVYIFLSPFITLQFIHMKLITLYYIHACTIYFSGCML